MITTCQRLTKFLRIASVVSITACLALAEVQEPDRATNPNLVKQTRPSYTDEAIQAGIEGTTLLLVVVRKDGSVDSFKIVKPLGCGLDEKAIEEIANHWVFKPGTANGKPVDVRATIEVTFSLRGRGSKPKFRSHLFQLKLNKPYEITLVEVKKGIVRDAFKSLLQLQKADPSKQLFDLKIGGKASVKRQRVCRPIDLRLNGRKYRIVITGVGGDSANGLLMVPEGAPYPGKLTEPEKLTHESPIEHTSEARSAGVEGKVRLEAVIRKDGSADRVKVLKPRLGYGLDERASSSVRAWKFQPATLNGKPVDRVVILEVPFKLP